MRSCVVPAAAVLLTALAAQAQTMYNNSVTPNWTIGSGQPNAGFVTNDNSALNVQTGLSSFYRWGIRGPGDFTLRDSLVNNVYTYRNGEAYTDSTGTTFATGLAAYAFSYHANLNTTGGGSLGQNLANNTVLLTIDWDPTAGVDQRTYNFSQAAVATFGVGGASSITLLQGTENLGFGFWDNPAFLAATGSTARTSAFNPFALGTYRIQMDIIRGGNNISSSEMFINVVPTPAAASLLGLGMVAAGRRRR